MRTATTVGFLGVLVAAGLLVACGGGSGPTLLSDVSNGLVASWPGDGSTADAVGGADGTPTAGFAYGLDRLGRPASAWVFDGVSARVDVEGAPVFQLLSGGTGVTISFWCRSADQAFNGSIVHGDLFSCWGALSFTMIRGTTNTVFGTMPNDVWTHIVCTYDDVTDMMTIYRDGILEASDLKGGSPGGYGVNFIRFGQSTWPAATYWAGSLDEVRMYDRALSASEVQALYAYQQAN